MSADQVYAGQSDALREEKNGLGTARILWEYMDLPINLVHLEVSSKSGGLPLYSGQRIDVFGWCSYGVLRREGVVGSTWICL